MEIEGVKKDEKKVGRNDYYPEASRYTLAILLTVLIIWSVYDFVKTGVPGFQLVLVGGTVIVLGVIRRYLVSKNSKN